MGEFMKKKVIILITSILLAVGCLVGGLYAAKIEIVWLRLTLNIICNLLIGLIAYIAIKLSGMKIDFEWKNYKQYLIGILICIILSFCIAWLPALLGYSLVGSKTNFVLWIFFFELLYFFLVIGPVEELFFRVYIQGFFVDLFKKHKWIGVIIASALFGLFHLLGGGWIQVAFTFGFGLVFGFAKQYIKDMHYPGISVCHGLYDFLSYVVRITVL